MSKKKEIKDIVLNPGLHLNDKQQKSLTEDSMLFMESNAKVNVYVENNQYPINIYNLPKSK